MGVLLVPIQCDHFFVQESAVPVPPCQTRALDEKPRHEVQSDSGFGPRGWLLAVSPMPSRRERKLF